jgi:hypothetical protein
MRSVPTTWVWINLWKLWIAFGGSVGCRVRLERSSVTGPARPRPEFLGLRWDGVSLVR